MIHQECEQILIGTLLGDSHIQNIMNKRKFRLSGTHTIKQKQWALYKINKLKNFLDIKYIQTIKQDKKYITFWSKTSKELTSYHDIFYKDGTKKITNRILNKLKPLALAIWICDDGSYDYRYARLNLNTQGFTLQEHILIQKYFKKQYGLNTNISKDKIYYYLRFNVENTKKFIRLIKQFVPNSMNYKLGMDKQKKEDAIIKNKQYVRHNIKKLKRYWKQYHKKNQIKIQKCKQNYYQKNKIKIQKQNHKNYQKNKDRIKKRSKKYYYKNKKKIK